MKSTTNSNANVVCQYPKEWKLRRLGDFGDSYSGLSGKSKEDFGDGYTYVPYKNVFLNAFVSENFLERVAIEPGETQSQVEKGDILFTISSETPEEVGMSSVVAHKPAEELYLNSFCFGFRPRESCLDIAYSGYAFRSEYMRRRITFLAQGSTRYNISKKKVLDIKLPVPPLHEQRGIAEILITVDSKLNLISRQIEVAQILKRGLIQKLFSRGAVGNDMHGEWTPRNLSLSPPGVLPNGWQVVRLGDIAPLVRRPVDVHSEGIYPELGLRSYGKGTFHKPALRGQEVGNKRLFEIKEGDLLFSNVFAWEGAVAVAREEDDGRFGSHRYITCVVDKSRARVDYLFRFLTTSAGLALLELASPGGAGRNKTLGLSALANIPIPLPPLAQQKKVSLMLNEVDKKTASLLARRAQCEALKQGLMQKLLTGEWRVKAAVAEIAA
ncbi:MULTISPECIES: restriction endonuclease subunit S [unclassified Paraburkholderia]|uniref:restriction endonuclease subunit S n=1 Tax=unclassified Paraburkholderia TaxID=2615204 RepID=UPI002AB243A2|nr:MULTISPECIES: restriction endonuclease subunit S [unclassified Paraburkholderia]